MYKHVAKARSFSALLTKWSMRDTGVNKSKS